METFVLWVSFAGSWLLFAGPIFQATLELRDEDIEIDRIHVAGAKVERADKVSAWWWLLPPVKFYLEFKRRKQYERRYLQAMQREDIEALVSFRSKATAWLYVAGGGLCVAIKETYEVVRHEAWNDLIWLVLIFGMFIVSIVTVVLQIKRAERIKRS